MGIILSSAPFSNTQLYPLFIGRQINIILIECDQSIIEQLLFAK